MIPVEPTPTGLMTAVGLVVLGGVVLLLGYRLVAGPSFADRILAMDMIGNVLAAIFVVVAISHDQAEFLSVAALLALINFLGTLAFAGYLYGRPVS